VADVVCDQSTCLFASTILTDDLCSVLFMVIDRMGFSTLLARDGSAWQLRVRYDHPSPNAQTYYVGMHPLLVTIAFDDPSRNASDARRYISTSCCNRTALGERVVFSGVSQHTSVETSPLPLSSIPSSTLCLPLGGHDTWF